MAASNDGAVVRSPLDGGIVAGLVITSATVPSGARPSARVLVLSEQNRLLLLEARDAPGGHRWWVAPGGGLEAGETFEAAAERELHEETGLRLTVGPWVWTRRHNFTWQERQHDQYERYFVARTAERPLAPSRADSYVIGHRWWSLAELSGPTRTLRRGAWRASCQQSSAVTIPNRRSTAASEPTGTRHQGGCPYRRVA